AARLAACGVPSDPSQGNFILARLADAAEAEAADAHLRAAGIIVRRVAGYGLPEALRITIGREEDCARVAAAVADFMRGRR
ncbi:MAG: aminotransferase class I/II-fold pyridoxal phosphate-dependent enzyme, partial [Gemmobacter sp.]